MDAIMKASLGLLSEDEELEDLAMTSYRATLKAYETFRHGSTDPLDVHRAIAAAVRERYADIMSASETYDDPAA